MFSFPLILIFLLEFTKPDLPISTLVNIYNRLVYILAYVIIIGKVDYRSKIKALKVLMDCACDMLVVVGRDTIISWLSKSTLLSNIDSVAISWTRCHAWL